MLSAQRHNSLGLSRRTNSEFQEVWLEAAYEQEQAIWRHKRAVAAATASVQQAPRNADGRSAGEASHAQHAQSVPPTVMAMGVSAGAPVTPTHAQMFNYPSPQIQLTMRVGKSLTETQRRAELKRLAAARQHAEAERKAETEHEARLRRQRMNWYRRPTSDDCMPDMERKKARERLYRRPVHAMPRPRSPTALGHVLRDGTTSTGFERARIRYRATTPKSRAPVSPAGSTPPSSVRQRVRSANARGSSEARRATESTSSSHQGACDPGIYAEHYEAEEGDDTGADRDSLIDAEGEVSVAGIGDGTVDGVLTEAFEGLTTNDFHRKDWSPSFTYRPAKQQQAWVNLDGFSRSTRTLERRKMNPFADIQSYNAAGRAAGYVRPLDVKGQLGALPVQQWKETLREDFALDTDNYSTNAQDEHLDELRYLLGPRTE